MSVSGRTMFDMLDDSVRSVSEIMIFLKVVFFYRRIIDGGRIEAKVWLHLYYHQDNVVLLTFRI